jgi:hypothetical protein
MRRSQKPEENRLSLILASGFYHWILTDENSCAHEAGRE